ncbi:hypothetical protein Ctob_015656, partial [Chrysochromulina tobinii]
MPRLTNEQLAHLLQSRAEAKARRDFAAADAIWGQLDGYGIKIIDGRQPGMIGTWAAADGRRGNTSGPDYFLDPLASAPSAATGEAPPGATISNADLIAQLQARQEAKARRDFATADAIRFALERQHRVKVYDTTKSWIANDGRKGNTVGPNFFSLDGTKLGAVMAPIITKSLAPTDDVQQQLDAVKSTLYTYEVAFESQNGYKPRTRAEWGEVWAEYE